MTTPSGNRHWRRKLPEPQDFICPIFNAIPDARDHHDMIASGTAVFTAPPIVSICPHDTKHVPPPQRMPMSCFLFSQVKLQLPRSCPLKNLGTHSPLSHQR